MMTRTATKPTDRTHHAALMRQLHAEGARVGLDHDALRRNIQDTRPGIESLTDLTDRDLEHYIRFLRGAKPPKPSSRKRSGRRQVDGTVRMITQAQQDFINTLASELAWTAGQLSKFLQVKFDVDSIVGLGTTARAGQAITLLKSIKVDRTRRRRRAPTTRRSSHG